MASANEFWDLCAVIELMEPQAAADITQVSCYIPAMLILWQRVSLISKMFMCVCMLVKMLDMFKIYTLFSFHTAP